jgi:lon-related putative ATP-dependent protease
MQEWEVAAPDLFTHCDPERLGFETTLELEGLDVVLGQQRAVEAMHFGIGIPRKGFNLYAMGSPGAGKHAAVRDFLKDRAATEEVPSDWCYVSNFHEEHRPIVLRFPPGRAEEFHHDMERWVDDLKAALPEVFEGEEFRLERQAIEEEFSHKQEETLSGIRERAKEQGIALVRTPGGFAFAPEKEGEVLAPEEYNELPAKKRSAIEKAVEGFHEELGRLLHQRPKWRREAQAKITELSRRAISSTVSTLMEELKKKYEDLPSVQKHLDAILADLVEHADQLHPSKEGEPMAMLGMALRGPQHDHEAIFLRYRVNVLIDHSKTQGAPVVYEDNPTLQNLVGRVEHVAQMGALVTDFTLIKPGALHRANGGYLILDVLKVLMQPYAWEGVKRCLRAGEIKTESLGQMLSLISTVSLEPQAVPLRVKIVLVGERMLYYLLHQLDEDFADLFKVAVDFEEEIDRSDESTTLYARWIATLIQREDLQAFDKKAVARVIEQASRMAGDAEKISVHLRSLADLLREADYWAREEGREIVTADDVQRAIDARIFRADRIRSRLREQISRERILIATEGDVCGQINGLSVLQLGDFRFGNPSRITARVRMGPAKVIDIEREVELGGALHSKGVLILSGFLAGRFLPEQPLSMMASLVFEQSYGGIDGDSASSAELYALLSALAEVPIRQFLAVTGSVNQQGEVQAIGGVNEKVEGFFDVCRERGLTGRQGVLIPAANKTELMLRHDVVAAVKKGRFHVYAIRTVDEGLEILTGAPAGQRKKNGRFPAGTINHRVEARLQAFARRAASLQHPSAGKKS